MNDFKFALVKFCSFFQTKIILKKNKVERLILPNFKYNKLYTSRKKNNGLPPNEYYLHMWLINVNK